MTKSFFSEEEDIGDWYVFRVMKYKSFHNTNRKNKRSDRMCLLSVWSSGVPSFRYKVVSLEVDSI